MTVLRDVILAPGEVKYRNEIGDEAEM